MSGTAEVVRLRLQLDKAREQIAALETDLKTMRSLLWSVHIAGQGYLWKGPDGITRELNPIDVVTVIDASKAPTKERMAGALERARALAETLPPDIRDTLLECLKVEDA